MGEFSWGETSRAPGSHLLGGRNQNPTTVCWQLVRCRPGCCLYLFPLQPPTIVDSFGVGHSSIPTSPTYHHKLRTSSGDSCRQIRHNAMMLGEYTHYDYDYPICVCVKYQPQDAVILFLVYHLLPTYQLGEARPVKLSNFCLNINLETTQLRPSQSTVM